MGAGEDMETSSLPLLRAPLVSAVGGLSCEGRVRCTCSWDRRDGEWLRGGEMRRKRQAVALATG